MFLHIQEGWGTFSDTIKMEGCEYINWQQIVLNKMVFFVK